jgi:LacI family transcriptional regulator
MGVQRLARATISDVARMAGVSSMTVSRVINERPNVSPETRARVLEAIERLGYMPSAHARGLAVGRSNAIGILVPDIISEWTLPLVLGAARAAEHRGYRLILHTTGTGKVERESTQETMVSADLIDGLIVASWRVPISWARKVDRQKLPVVLVDGYTRPQDVLWVSATDRGGMREAARHLLQLGHRRIAFIGGGEKAYLARQRFTGFVDALEEAGLSLDSELVRQGDFTRESGYRQAYHLFQSGPRPSVLLCASDPMAVGALQALHELGLGVPEQVSVMGFDDTLAPQTSPPLTTVRRPYAEMGEVALRLLVEEADRPHRQVDLPVELVIRASVAPPR